MERRANRFKFFSRATVADRLEETSLLMTSSLLIVPSPLLLAVVLLNPKPVHGNLVLAMIMSVITTMTVVIIRMKLNVVRTQRDVTFLEDIVIGHRVVKITLTGGEGKVQQPPSTLVRHPTTPLRMVTTCTLKHLGRENMVTKHGLSAGTSRE